MKVCSYPVFLFAFLFLLQNFTNGAGKIPDSNIVATYNNDYSVTAGELNKYIEDWLYYKKFKTRSDVFNNALNDLLINQFKRIDFFEKGLDRQNELPGNAKRIINEELVNEYFDEVYVSRYANEKNAEKVYGIMDKEVFYVCIVLKKPGNAGQKQLDSLSKKAIAIKSEIENGKNFSALVKKYSQDEISLQNNGVMPPVDWKRSISDAADEIIFNLKKNDVRVLNTDDAFLIVKVTEVKKIDLAPFDSLKENIILNLKDGYSDAINNEFVKDKKNLINENTLQWNETALEQVVQWSNIPNFYKSKYQEIIKDELSKGNNKIILTYNDNNTLDYKDFLVLLDNILVYENSGNVKEDDVKKYILEAIRIRYIAEKADSLGFRKNIYNAYTNDVVLKNQIVYLYNQAEVEARLPEANDEALHKYFAENENTLYYQLEKRNIFVMVFGSKEETEKAYQKISSGVPFEKVTGSYLVKTFIKEKNGEVKSFLNDEKPVLADAAFKMKESEVSSPVEFRDENGQTRYAIIKCYNIRPEKQLTFNDVKDSIAEDFKNYHRKIIEKDLEEKLKEKYHPVINEVVLNQLISVK